MNRIQKQSWIMIISTAIAFFFSCIVVTYLALTKGFPTAWYGFLFVYLGALGYIPCSFVKKDTPAITDERDLAIKALAKNNCFIAAYISLILLAMGVFFYHGPNTLINVNILPMGVCIIGVVFWMVESLTYIIEYGKDNKQSGGGAV